MSYYRKINHLVLNEQFKCDNQTVLVRVDFNVPVLNQEVTNDYRLKRTLKTLQFLIDKNCKIILLSHLGRPKKTDDLQKFSLAPVAKHLQTLINTKVYFCPESNGNKVHQMIKKLSAKEILLLENTRFHNLSNNLENNNDLELAKSWADLAEFYVFDAFATGHRLHASTIGLAEFFGPNKIALGFLVADEITKFHNLIDQPRNPFVVVMGGGKPASKLPMIAKILPKIDKIIINGALSYTFYEAQNISMGDNNPIAKELLPQVREWLKLYRNKIILPIDFATTKEFANVTPTMKSFLKVEKDDYCLDCGPQSILEFNKILKTAKLIVWNGPPGVFEWSYFQTGTKEILNTCEQISNNCQTIIGGGDSAAAAFQFSKKLTNFTHISTGGGAFLILLETDQLPVITEILKLTSVI